MTMKYALCALVLFASGCLTPDDPPPIRWFDPALPPLEGVESDPARGRRVRVGSGRVAQNLGERIVWRRSDVETGFWELRRWNEPPAQYVQRALERELFERRGALRGTAAADPHIVVNLERFEHELLGEPAARVRFSLELATRDEVWLDETFEVREVLEGDDPAEFARAMGRALDRAVREAGEAASVQLGLRTLP